MPHHSEDYKLSAVKYYLDHNEDMRDTCKIFRCKFQSLGRWINQYNKFGTLKRKTRKHTTIKVSPEMEVFVKQYVKKHPTSTLWDSAKQVSDTFGINISDSTIHDILTRHRITRKRLRSKYYPEKRIGQEKDDLTTFYNTLSEYDYKKTICLDETSIYLNMNPSYGRSRSGTRVVKKTTIYPYKRFNMLCAISAGKVIGWELYKDLQGGVKTQDVLDFYDKYIKDTYKKHLIIMDNAVIHKSKLIKEHIAKTENTLLYSVPYHPETNAIEEFFSQLKHYIKKESPNTYEDIDKVIKSILKDKITPKHLENYIKHSYKIYD